MPVDQTAVRGAGGLVAWRDQVARQVTRVLDAGDTVLARPWAWIGAIIGVLSLQTVLTMRHSAWLDEWQALQIAVQSPAMSDLFTNLRYEGHPPLWYLILRGLGAVLHDQARALPLAALVIALPLQLTILLAAPLRRIDRVMLALSEFVLFEYGTVSRSLSLGVALMIVTMALWRRRRWPWVTIALLPLCDFWFGVISILFVALRMREQRLHGPLAALWIAAAMVAAWTVRPLPDMVPAIVPPALWRSFATWMADTGTLGLPLQWHFWAPEWNNPPPLGLGGLAAAGFAALVWIELRHDRMKLAAFGAITLMTLGFSLWIYPLAVRHLMVLAIVLICLVWHGCLAPHGTTRRPTVWFSAWLLVAALCGLATAAINLAIPFDRSQQAVALIAQLGLRDKTWVSFPRYTRQGIAALSAMPFERLGDHCSEVFIRWNDRAEKQVQNIPALYRALGAKRDVDGRFYFISTLTIPPVPGLLRQIGKVDGGYDGQDFVLYVVGENRRDARPHGQSCIGPVAPLRVLP
jgi:hypothetical protein